MLRVLLDSEAVTSTPPNGLHSGMASYPENLGVLGFSLHLQSVCSIQGLRCAKAKASFGLPGKLAYGKLQIVYAAEAEKGTRHGQGQGQGQGQSWR